MHNRRVLSNDMTLKGFYRLVDSVELFLGKVLDFLGKYWIGSVDQVVDKWPTPKSQGLESPVASCMTISLNKIEFLYFY